MFFCLSASATAASRKACMSLPSCSTTMCPTSRVWPSRSCICRWPFSALTSRIFTIILGSGCSGSHNGLYEHFFSVYFYILYCVSLLMPICRWAFYFVRHFLGSFSSEMFSSMKIKKYNNAFFSIIFTISHSLGKD